jgi:hypothetical protein
MHGGSVQICTAGACGTVEQFETMRLCTFTLERRTPRLLECTVSRGPGRWQRLLLASLEESDLVVAVHVVYHHLGRSPTRAEMVAVRRAVRRLAERGEVRAIYVWGEDSVTQRADLLLAITRPDGSQKSIPVGHKVPAWISGEKNPQLSEEEAEELTLQLKEEHLARVSARLEADRFAYEAAMREVQERRARLVERRACVDGV